eukprot:scpid93466/ scgid14755/ Polycomb group RING finger protein 3; RING finger protein 3A
MDRRLDEQAISDGGEEPVVRGKKRPDRTINVRDLTPHITCGLCSGYLVNAATVTECLHSFCRSCIVKHLHVKRDCPTCRIVIHEAYPLHYVRMDRTMSDIVYKLVPGLQKDEIERERAYNEEHGIVPEVQCDAEPENNPSFAQPSTNGVQSVAAPSAASTTAQSRSPMASSDPDSDGLIAIHLKRRDPKEVVGKRSPTKKLQRPFICMSSKATVNILRKYIKTKLSLSDTANVDVLFDDQVLGKEHSLEFLSRTRWRLKKTDVVDLTFTVAVP